MIDFKIFFFNRLIEYIMVVTQHNVYMDYLKILKKQIQNCI